jgi:hypothetical protein
MVKNLRKVQKNNNEEKNKRKIRFQEKSINKKEKIP